MDKGSNKLFEICCTKELEMLLSDCALLIYLSGLTRNVSSINDKLHKFLAAFGIVFAHADVTPPVGPPYWITASGLYPLLSCKLAIFSN